MSLLHQLKKTEPDPQATNVVSMCVVETAYVAVNKIVGSQHVTVPLQDARWVAEIAMNQISNSEYSSKRYAADLLLHDTFALGYAIGFAEQAGWHLSKGDGEKNCPDYLRKVIGFMLGNDAVAASFVSFAASKQGDRTFEGGYDAGMHDMDALYLSFGDEVPMGLHRHLFAPDD